MEKNQFNVKKIFQTNTDKKVTNIVVDTEVEATIQQKMIRFYVYGHFITLALVEMPVQFLQPLIKILHVVVILAAVLNVVARVDVVFAPVVVTIAVAVVVAIVGAVVVTVFVADGVVVAVNGADIVALVVAVLGSCSHSLRSYHWCRWCSNCCC